MNRKEAYPAYINLSKKSCKIIIPDFQIDVESECITTLAQAMDNARHLIESKAKSLEEENKDIPSPGTEEYKKNKGDIFTYIDANTNEFLRKRKSLEELEKMEEGRIYSMWDVRENVIEFMVNQKVMAVTLTQRKLINRVTKYAERYPDEVRIERQNEDSSIFAKVPVNYLRIVRPSGGRIMTTEEKERNIKRLEKGRLIQQKNKEEKSKIKNS